MLLCLYKIGEKDYKVRGKRYFFKSKGSSQIWKKTVVQHAYYCTVSEMKEYQKFIIQDKSVEFFFSIFRSCVCCTYFSFIPITHVLWVFHSKMKLFLNWNIVIPFGWVGCTLCIIHVFSKDSREAALHSGVFLIVFCAIELLFILFLTECVGTWPAEVGGWELEGKVVVVVVVGWRGGGAVWPLASFLLILRRPSVLGALIRVCLVGLHLCCCHAN